MPNSVINKRVVIGGSRPSFPLGDIFNDSFAPKTGTYVDVGSGTSAFTSGNMAVAGGNGFFTNYTKIQDVAWSGNNWYLEATMVFTNTNAGQYSACFGLQSLNPIQSESVYFGTYSFTSNNVANILIFGSNPLSGNINTPVTLGISVGDLVRVRGELDLKP